MKDTKDTNKKPSIFVDWDQERPIAASSAVIRRRGGLKMAPSGSSRKHDSNVGQNGAKTDPPIPTATGIGITNNKDIVSSRRHSMDYVTVNGVILRTGYADKKTWYLLCLKELWDNSIDFEWKYYQGATDAAIDVEITKTSNSMFHVKVRNTNKQNIPVFQNLSAIFDYDMRYGSKQNQRIISRGMLGDAMKQVLAWPYVLIHSKDDGTAFIDKQWHEPLIIRCNKIERHIFLHVDKGNQIIRAEIKELPIELSHTDTEIELTWPITDDIHLDIHEIEEFCKIYPILTTDISFKIKLVDNSPDTVATITTTSNSNSSNSNSNSNSNSSIEEKLVSVLTSPARKAAIKIEFPALHPIATGWNNISSIHSYMPEEFVTAITSVFDKESIQVYDVLRMFREGNMIKKNPSDEISVAQLMQDPNKDEKIEARFNQLKHVSGPPKSLSLPYNPTSNKIKDTRKQALVDRVMQLYPNLLDAEAAFYKVFTGFYNDDYYRKIWSHDGQTYHEQRGRGILHYPFIIEVITVPYNHEALEGSTQQATRFIGSINYSVSPKSTDFKGDYEWSRDKGDKDPWDRDIHHSKDITDILKELGFRFWGYSDAKIRLPSIIILNIVSSRIDYHGHDKSQIDTNPFAPTIIEACKKTAEKIKTFRGAGFTFSTARYRDYTPRESKVTVESALTEFLRKRKDGLI